MKDLQSLEAGYQSEAILHGSPAQHTCGRAWERIICMMMVIMLGLGFRA